MLTPAWCMQGEEAARLFYGEGNFTRRHAIPVTALTLLQDRGSVQLPDGPAHRVRKKMFMAMMSRERLEALAEITGVNWREAAHRWEHGGSVKLLSAVQEIFSRSVCHGQGSNWTKRRRRRGPVSSWQ